MASMRVSVFSIALIVAAAALSTVSAKVLYHEEFNNINQWVSSTHKSDYGKVAHSAGRFSADAEKDKGLQLTEDARFYAISTKLPTPVSNEKKNFVVSFSVKHDQDIKCGGGYIKLLPAMDQKDFHGDSQYWLMFGPDRCGSTNKVHIIISHDGTNHEWRKNVRFPEDLLTHVYTLHISAEGSYEFYLDGVSKEKGTLEADWSIVKPKEIPDPDDKKPEDWVDDAKMDDPQDKKPDDWDAEPEMIADAEAKKPDDWDDAEDGEWEAPTIPNPKAKGPWRPKQIDNPAYKGPWTQRKIANPDYKPLPDLYKAPEPIEYIGIDVWQVESGSVFNNIIIGDDVKEVLDIVQKTHGSSRAAEQEALDAYNKAKEQTKKAEEEEKKAEEEEKKVKEEKEAKEADDTKKEDL